MHHDGTTSSDLSIVCNLFAKHFQSVYTNNFSNIPITSENSYSFDSINIGSLTLSIPEVELALASLNSDNRPDADGIPSIILQMCSEAFAIPLQLIFNRSLENGDFLSIWKKSFITPVHKSGSKQEVANYRPICKISTIPKLFEKLVYDKLTPTLRGVISSQQHGFVAGRSTTTNLTIFCNHVLNGLEKGLQYDVIYTDFSKAFDRVNHEVLLTKLKKVGFHSNLLKWINSYLRERVQYVRINNSLSSPIYATSGVPQGSHLGPLLFLIFINDIPDIFSYSLCLMFADDIKIFRCINSTQDCLWLQEDLNRLSAWCNKNDLHLNVSKCQSLTYCRNHSPIHYIYNICNIPLSTISVKKDLGVIFDQKFSFLSHIDFLISKSNSMLGFVLRNSKQFSNPQTLKCLFFAYVRSGLEYCSTIWNPFYEVHSLRIERIQKRFTRTVVRRLHWNMDMPSYDTRCKLLGLLPLHIRRKYFSVMFIRDIIMNHTDCSHLLSLVGLYAPVRVLRNRVLFHVPNHRVNYAFNEPISRCLREANTVCDFIDFSLSRNIFKTNLLLSYSTSGGSL